jgi:hypothetical protein
MSRAIYFLANAVVRDRVARLLATLPDMTRIEIKGPKRTIPQNAKMWAALTDVATQKEHCGRRYPPEDWKIIFLHALGRETRFVPSLDESGFIPIGQSSSDLSKTEMSDLLELIQAWGAQNGVAFQEPIYQDPREAA